MARGDSAERLDIVVLGDQLDRWPKSPDENPDLLRISLAEAEAGHTSHTQVPL